MNNFKLALLTAGVVGVLMLAGCGGGGGYDNGASNTPMPPPPPPPPVGESFTTWSKSGVFAKPAEGAPEIMDTLVFNFDGNDNPDAYAELLPPQS